MTDTPAERGAESTWDQAAPPQGRPVGSRLRRGRLGLPAGPRVPQRHLRLAASRFSRSPPSCSSSACPSSLVLAWYHGDRGEQRISGTELAILALLFLVGGGHLLALRPRERDHRRRRRSTHCATAAPARSGPAPDEKSIAVLPFVDMSAAKDQEYMSDGIAEELLNLLAKAPGPESDRPHLLVRLQGREDRHRGDRKAAERRPRAGRQRPHVRQQAAHHRAADPHRRQHAPVVGDLRPHRSTTSSRCRTKSPTRSRKRCRSSLPVASLSRREGGTQNLEAYQLYLRALEVQQLRTPSRRWTPPANTWSRRSSSTRATARRGLLGVDVANKADNGLSWTRQRAMNAHDELAQHALQVSPESAEAHAGSGTSI